MNIRLRVGINIETVKIWDDPTQFANSKPRIIDTTQLRFHASKL